MNTRKLTSVYLMEFLLIWHRKFSRNTTTTDISIETSFTGDDRVITLANFPMKVYADRVASSKNMENKILRIEDLNI